MFRFPVLPPLSLYVHIPWCLRKCPYCDFNSHPARRAIPEDRYIDALTADLEQSLPWIGGRVIQSIFIGGGTPSLFSPEAINRLLSGVDALTLLAPEAEITLEANPGAADCDRFTGYRRAGVNRLSIGIQSFQPQQLAALGRIHGREEALRAVKAARVAGFDNINLDLMYGLPGQTIAEALDDARTAIALQPEHLSVYQLTIEPNTLFHARRPPLPDDDDIWEMQAGLQALMEESGYDHYEVSAYALPGRQCRHNLNYWRFGDYLGIGAGAHGKVTGADGITRTWKAKHPEAYMEKAATRADTGGRRLVSPREATLEFMMNALRLCHGFPVRLFAQRTGLPLSAAEGPLRLSGKDGLIAQDAHTIIPTERGKRYLNNLVERFV